MLNKTSLVLLATIFFCLLENGVSNAQNTTTTNNTPKIVVKTNEVKVVKEEVKETKEVKKEEAKPATTNVELPKPPPLPDNVKAPVDVKEAIDSGKGIVGAFKSHQWWFASAMAVFVIMFTLNLLGVFAKLGTFWAWVMVGCLSLAAAIFAAFGKDGFSWSTLMGYMTAGPTIAWIRDFFKDAIMKKKEQA